MGATLPSRVWLRIERLLDSDSVRPFIYPYYLPFLVWSIYGSFFARPIRLIIDLTGQLGYNLWVWTPMAATVAAMMGLYLRHGGSPAEEISEPLLRQDYAGLWMQFGGHACMHIVLWVYVVTGFMGATWGDPVISVILLTSFIFGSGLLALQCLRKLYRGRRVEKQWSASS